MIDDLKKVVIAKGAVKVAADLGYRSQTTIRKWIANDKIPFLAQNKVAKYLAKKEKKK
jgi:hypothetical protein